YAPKFGAQLSGVPPQTFVAIQGEFAWRPHAAPGTKRDAEVLAGIDMDAFNRAETEAERAACIRPLLDHAHVAGGKRLEADLYAALENFPPLGLLINTTMKQARPIAELGRELFPDAPE